VSASTGNGADLYQRQEICRARGHTCAGGENTNFIPFRDEAQGQRACSSRNQCNIP
jgi:hypothetical protein